MEHLVTEHPAKDLKAWGLNIELLKKFIKNDQDKHLSKRKRKFNAKIESEGQAQA